MLNKNIPVLVLNEVALFPSVDIRLDFEDESIKKLINISEKYFHGEILMISKEDPLEESPAMDELLKVGVSAQITLKMELPNRKLRVTFHGLKRMKVAKFYEEDGILHAKCQSVLVEEIEVKEEIAYLRMLKNMIIDYIQNIPRVGNMFIDQIRDINDLDTLTDFIAFTFHLPNDRRQEYLLEMNQITRAKMLIQDIRQDFEIIELEKKIEEEVGKRLDKNQKEFVLREKIKVIKEELGESYDQDSEIIKYKQQMEDLSLKDEVIDKLNREIGRLESLPSSSPEVGVIQNYITWLLSLPWNKQTDEDEDLIKIESILNKNHYGLTDVKNRILEYIALKQNTNNSESPIICLVGPPGVGKTTLAKSIAEALNRKSVKISVGGIQDEADIIGHRRTYIGAQPGLIIQGMKKAKVNNPVFIIDEIDKMTKSIHGDPASSLLEVLDKEQNSKFIDHYIEEEFDLSKVFFITTANYIEQIPYELLDRLEIIELSSYTELEKLEILNNHIIPKAYNNYNISKSEIIFKQEALLYMIRNYTKEAGVRELERTLLKILRKIIKEKLMSSQKKLELNIEILDIKKYLGIEMYDYDKKIESSAVGVVNALSYTPFGGDTLRIEATLFKGNGNLILTGSLGEVMRESASVCLSYIKANAKKFNISPDIFLKNDIHIHAEENAVKKDGPSAGVSLTTVLLSILMNVELPSDVAMTGEMTLRGKVLPIGGVKEKVIGAHKRHIEKIFLPRDNERDLKEVDEIIRTDIEFIFVDNYMDIYNNLFKRKKSKARQLEETIELIQLEL